MSHYNELTVGLIRLDSYSAATMPPASQYVGCVILVTQNTSPGKPTLAFSDGVHWYPLTPGSTPIS